jgi:hypothetical protein
MLAAIARIKNSEPVAGLTAPSRLVFPRRYGQRCAETGCVAHGLGRLRERAGDRRDRGVDVT